MTTRDNAPGQAGMRGFSFLEVLLVMTLLGILMSMAVPGYQAVTMRAHRTEAITSLMQAAVCQERLRMVSGAYQPGSCLPDPTKRYRFSAAPETSQPGLKFTLTASPQGPQVADACGWISLDQDGFRSVGEGGVDAERCWSGR